MKVAQFPQPAWRGHKKSPLAAGPSLIVSDLLAAFMALLASLDVLLVSAAACA
jgi:hypothetical protein